MSILYRKVLCSDRLPNDSNYRDTDRGVIYCWKGLLCNQNGPLTFTPEWWLEEVTIPTDEEIENRAEKWRESKGLKNAGVLVSDHSAYRKLSKTWTDSFKAALELLTGCRS